MTGEAADMQFIDDQFGNREVERPVVLTVKVVFRNAPAMGEDVVRPRRLAKDRTSADRPGKGINQDVTPIEAVPGAWIEGPFHAVAVFDFIGINVEDHHGEDVAHPEFRREGNFGKGTQSAFLEKDQGAGGGV